MSKSASPPAQGGGMRISIMMMQTFYRYLLSIVESWENIDSLRANCLYRSSFAQLVR